MAPETYGISVVPALLAISQTLLSRQMPSLFASIWLVATILAG
jgi:hypothetical protein